MKSTFLIFLTFIFITLSNITEAQVIQEWVTTYNGPANLLDEATDLTVDKDGNVYVTGKSMLTALNEDYCTIKYDKSGNQLWIATYNGPGDYHDNPNTIALDAFGNVYVTGWSKGVKGTADDYCTIKYSPDGTEKWVARYNGSKNNWDRSHDLAVDNSGNVYVTGFSVHIADPVRSSGEDFVTFKYDTDGQIIWQSNYDWDISTDQALAMTIDGAGNVFVTGKVNAPAYHWATIKYNPSGQQEWVAEYKGNVINNIHEPIDVKLDGAGNVYVTGFSSNKDNNKDFCTIKYDPSGIEQWVKIYNGPGNKDDMPTSFAVDASGNAYVTGVSIGVDSKKDYCTIKYNTAGNEEWVAKHVGTLGAPDEMNSIALDKDGNIYMTGTGIVNVASLNDIVTIKYDDKGNKIWQKSYNGPDSSMDEGRAIFVDTKGNVYVTGLSFGTSSVSDFCTIKYSQK